MDNISISYEGHCRRTIAYLTRHSTQVANVNNVTRKPLTVIDDTSTLED